MTRKTNGRLRQRRIDVRVSHGWDGQSFDPEL
jgi:hypothetical protein